MAFAPIAQRALGQALAAPVERRDGKAAGAQIAHGLEIFFDALGAALENADRALAPGRRRQRAKRSDTPSGVFSVPVTTLSGTGLAGIETSFMRAVKPKRPDAYSSPSQPST